MQNETKETQIFPARSYDEEREADSIIVTGHNNERKIIIKNKKEKREISYNYCYYYFSMFTKRPSVNSDDSNDAK